MSPRPLLILLALAACSNSGTQSVDYYKTHASERSSRVNQCLGLGDTSADCRNARQAEFEIAGIKAKDGSAVIH